MWFEGYTRDNIAKTLMTSEGHVSSTVASLPSCLEPMRDLSKRLRKLNLLPHDALKGANVIQQLTELYLAPEQISTSIQALKKTSTDANFTPEQVIQAATELVNLENQAGKKYSQAIKDFQTKTNQTQQLDKKITNQKQQLLKLNQEVKEIKQQRTQTLKRANVTEKEISHLKNIETTLNIYGIDLSNTEEILMYLENMKETEFNPKRFISFTKKIGSIKNHISQLTTKEQSKKEALNILKKDVEAEATELDQAVSNHQTFMIQTQKEIIAIQKTKHQADEILTQQQNEVNKTNTLLYTTKKAITETQTQKQEITNETESILDIKNCAQEHQNAIYALQIKRLLLADEVETQSNKIAFATVIYDFLITQSDFDFEQFYMLVKQINENREKPNSPLKPILPNLTDAIRSKALEAFFGNPNFTNIYTNISNENQQLRTEIALLKQKTHSS